MITKITKKEFKRLEDLQRNRFFTCLLFTMPDGSTYKCDTTGAAGLKEILQFRRKAKHEEQQKQSLLDMQSMVI